MVLAPGGVGVAFVVVGAAMLALLRKPLSHPGKPGRTGFIVAIAGISLWSVTLGASYLLADEAFAYAAYGVLMLSTSLTGVGWFLLATGFSRGRLPSRRLLAVLVAFVLVEQAIASTNGSHHLLLGADTTFDGSVLDPSYGPAFWAQAAINYGLISYATARLFVDWTQSTGLRRRQLGVLLVAPFPGLVANVASVTGLVDVPYDLTPLGFAASGLLLAWGLYRFEFLDVVPIARQTAMEEMADAVVTLDDENRVVDCNAAARDLFDVDRDCLGTPAETFFEWVDEETLARIETGTAAETRIAGTIADERRHFSLSISPVGGVNARGSGRVIVLRDVTEIVRHENEAAAREETLDLLRQVMSRVLRHNIRNELTVVKGNAELIERETDGDLDAQVRAIERASDDLLAISEKARTIERVVDTDLDSAPVDLRAVAENAARELEQGFPDVSVEVDGAHRQVRASPNLPTAVENLVENAAKYNDGPDQRVSITVDETERGPGLTIADNGPGIPPQEIEVLEAGRETPLVHGSGIGLWLVAWIVSQSEAALDIESDDDGTVVTIRFDDRAAAS